MSPLGHVSSLEETLEQSTVAHPATPGATLFVVVGPGSRTHRLQQGVELTLGRDPTSTVILADDPAASRQHARVSMSGDAVAIEDLRSRNGTFVDGRRTERAELDAGSVVRVGNTIGCLVRSTEDWQPVTAEGPLVGGCALAAARRVISLVGPTEMLVLITGETGTGKEVVARLVHAASHRTGPFIPVNCAALPEALVESELFGHARGAFTGAAQARRGLFASAAGGTLFLDEVGDLALAGQAKLLRVLEDRMVRPVGAEVAHEVDVRIISATNSDLAGAVERGQFRADLLARLGAVEIRLPPLRERREDIPLLAEHLLRRAGRSAALTADALEALLLHDWPHNVRELETVVRGAALAASAEIGLDHLPQRLRDNLHRLRDAGKPAPRSPNAPSAESRQAFIDALAATAGNLRRVSRELGISRGHVYRLLRRWGIDPAAFRRAGAKGGDEP
jgi:DNA-binding NtrC family response regulator